MKSFFAALRSLVLPYGTTSGKRIVLDGVNGAISTYDSTNTLVLQINPDTFTYNTDTRTIVIDNGGLSLTTVPGDGTSMELTTNPSFGGVIFLRPKNTAVPGKSLGSAAIFCGRDDTGTTSTRPFLQLNSPSVSGSPALHTSGIVLRGQSSSSATDNSQIDLTVCNNVVMPGGVTATSTSFTLPGSIVADNTGTVSDSNGHEFLHSENGAFLASWTTLDNFSTAVTFAHAFTNPPQVCTNIESNSGSVSRWGSRAYNVTKTGFQFFVFAPTATTTNGTNVRMSWSASEYT